MRIRITTPAKPGPKVTERTRKPKGGDTGEPSDAEELTGDTRRCAWSVDGPTWEQWKQICPDGESAPTSEHSDVGAYFNGRTPSLLSLSTINTKRAGERWIMLLERICSAKDGEHCILFQHGLFLKQNLPVFVASAKDSKHGSIAVKFAHPHAIEREVRILQALTDAGVDGIVRGYGCCYMNPFYGFTMELHDTNLSWLVRTTGVMKLKRIAALGKDLVRPCCARLVYSTQTLPRYLR